MATEFFNELRPGDTVLVKIVDSIEPAKAFPLTDIRGKGDNRHLVVLLYERVEAMVRGKRGMRTRVETVHLVEHRFSGQPIDHGIYPDEEGTMLLVDVLRSSRDTKQKAGVLGGLPDPEILNLFGDNS